MQSKRLPHIFFAEDSIAVLYRSAFYCQTRPADQILLWLAETQFPNREADLPKDLLALIHNNMLTVRWCDDLMPHKKYFYALQEYTDALIVTIDDDLFYPKDMLEMLYTSYLCYPRAVSAMRTHLIVLAENNEILPYAKWIKDVDICVHQPSMQLFATGGAGVLYPPGLYRKEFFDANAIAQTCPQADDLWLKAMQLLSDIPVVTAAPAGPLQYLPGSQSNALWLMNMGQNDTQLERICKWLDAVFEPSIFIRKLTAPGIGIKLVGIEALCAYFDAERKKFKADLNLARGRNQTLTEASSSASTKPAKDRKEDPPEPKLKEAYVTNTETPRQPESAKDTVSPKSKRQSALISTVVSFLEIFWAVRNRVIHRTYSVAQYTQQQRVWLTAAVSCTTDHRVPPAFHTDGAKGPDCSTGDSPQFILFFPTGCIIQPIYTFVFQVFHMGNNTTKLKQHMVDLLKYKDLLKLLVIKTVKLKYRRSILGYIWSIMNPLTIMMVMTIVFSSMFSRNIDNFPVYLFCGQLLFNFFESVYPPGHQFHHRQCRNAEKGLCS